MCDNYRVDDEWDDEDAAAEDVDVELAVAQWDEQRTGASPKTLDQFLEPYPKSLVARIRMRIDQRQRDER